MKYLQKALFCILIVCCLAFAGCAGYRLGNIQGAEMKDVKTIHVPMVKNLSYEPNLNNMVTSAIIRRIENDGTFSSSRSGDADALLEVVVTEVKRVSLRRSRADVQVTEEYELIMEAKATLTNLRSGTRIFTERVVTGRTTYYVQNDQQESERQSLPLAANNLAYNLVKLATDGW